ncbi:MAG: peptide-methionine (S)-S-oxide reductase MsrA [Acidobacteriota bacterium]
MPIDPNRTVTLGGGCFWCLEAFYERIDGIDDVESGYSGGHLPNPTYQQVCGDETGHAEVVQLKFDPAKISYREILEIFFTMHDPTTLNRQGADEGTQYRSIILYHTPQQKADAEALIKDLTDQRVFGSSKIVTQVVPFEAFYVAEVSHQDYYALNPNAGYCRVVIDPKVKKLQEKFAHRLKAKYR